MLAVAVLGPVEVRRDGKRISVPSGKTTEVLVRLALDAGLPVRADRIIEDLWAGAAASTGKNTLQSKVSQLRRALDEPGLITSSHGGYTLEIDAASVDALHVLDLAASATALRRSGDASAASEVSAEALSLFRGEVLVDAGEGDWLHAHRVRLEEVRLGLIEDQLAARVDLGAGGDVIGELEALVNRYPLREGLWFSLITALYRTGRQADALAAYQRIRETLVDELGLEPSPDLQALEDQILQQSPTLEGSTDRVRATVRPPTAGNLPALSSPLVGRATELDDLSRLVGRERLVTVVGPAGVGKTRLAIEVARGVEAAAGTWLVRLDATDATASISQAVAETLHVSGGEPMLFERVATADTLLVFDNCEHVVDAVADLTSRLLDASTHLRILATSQLPLGLDGETIHTLEPLPIAASIALFASRAVEIRKQFVLDDDTAATVEEVCLSLDGLPLAIELAAARVKSLSVREIARRLDDRFALLQDPTSRRPERRRALAGAIAWSYELLFPDDQRGLWALSCFAGGAPLAAAEHVLGILGVPEASAVDVVGRLVDRSLASVDISDDGAVRYRLLDSIRAFALDRLRQSSEDRDAFAAHASWFAEKADHAAATVRSTAQPECLAFVRAERANIDAALAWTAEHDPQLGVRIANGFGWTWVVLGDGIAGASRVRAALSAAALLTPQRDQAAGLLLAGWLEASAGNVERAEHDLDQALEVIELMDDDQLRADAQRHLAFLRIQQGRPQDSLDLANESISVYQPLQLHWEEAASLVLAAFALMVLGDTTRAAAAANDAVRLLDPIGDSWGLVHAQAMLGAIAQADHRFPEAATALAQAASASEQLGFDGQAALHLTNLGRVEQQAGNHQAAIDTLNRAIGAAVHSGDLRMAATARVNLARVLRIDGQDAMALSLLQQTDTWYRASGGGDGALLTKCLLASMSSPEDPTASEQLQAVLEEARAVHDQQVEVLTLDALARVAAEQGELDHAQLLLDTADRLIPGVQHLVDDADRVDAHLARARVSARLER